MDWGKKLSADAITKIIKGPYDVAGVLAFKDGDRMCHETAIKWINAFWHKADRVFFGRAADKGYGINRLCFLEFGKSQKCIHAHYVAQSIFDPVAFSAIMNVLWHTFREDTAEIADNWTAPIHDKQAVAEYVTKEMWRFRDDANVLNCDHHNLDAEAYKSFDAEARMLRLANHIDANLLEQALDKVPVHIIKIREQFEARQKAKAAKDRERAQRIGPTLASLRQTLLSRHS